MKLWLLTREDRIGWDENDAMLIRAESEQRAREMASEDNRTDPPGIWFFGTTTCVQVMEDGNAEVILVSFNAG